MKFRKAIIEDTDTIFNLSNDELTRKNSFNSDPIIYESHVKWFHSKVNNPNFIFLIFEEETKNIGLVRFNLENNEAIVGISINKDFRGKGLAKEMLKSASEYFIKNYKLPITALIKEENTASIKAFEQAGYVYNSNLIISSNNTRKYIYK